MPATLHSRLSIRPDVLAKRVGDETVILDLSSGTYFGLDAVGANIWALIANGRSLSEVCDTLLQRYDVERGMLERDVLRLVNELSAQKLIDTIDAGAC